MGIVRILLWLGYSLLSCAGLMAVTAVMGYINFEARDATLLSVVAVVTALTGALMITGSFRASTKESAAEAILFLMLFWVIVPIVCSVPFYALGAVPNPIAAMFEGVSAITTTGASRLVPEELSRTLLFWRSLLQYFGGASTATFAVVILAALNLSGTGIHRSGLFTFRTGELFPRIIGIGRLIGAIYLFFALLAFMLMVAGGTGAFDAICLALSGVGTGGLAPQSGPLTNYLSPFSAIVLSILCLMGAMNISVFWDVIRTRHVRVAMRVFTHVEHRGLFVLILLMVIVTVVFASLYNLGSAIVDSIFFISTAAFRYDVVSLDMVPAPILITVALIGGSALSTAGGIKIIRLILLFRHLGTDLARLSHPSRLVPIQFKRSPVDDDSFLSVWMYFFGYVICFAGGALALAASGLTLEDSLASSAASLANMGPLLELTLPGSGLRYADYTSLQMVIATLLMLIGRVEVLIALSLLLPSTWRQ
jgi:trk system potassium uptake protein TrkH